MQRTLSLVCMVTLLLFVQSQARAQEQEPFKKNLIGGNLSFATSGAATMYPNGESYDGTSFVINATYIHYLKKNIGIGATLSYNHFVADYPNPYVNNYKLNAHGFRPFVRFDIPLWQSRFSIFNDLGIGGSYTRTQTTDSNSVQTKDSDWGLEAFYNPGLMFRLKSNISIQASFLSLVGYTYRDLGNSHSFGITPNHSFNDLQFGVNFLF